MIAEAWLDHGQSYSELSRELISRYRKLEEPRRSGPSKLLLRIILGFIILLAPADVCNYPLP